MQAPSAQALAAEGVSELKAGRPDRARALLEQVVAGGRADASVWQALGYACRDLGDLDGLSRAVDQALRLAPAGPRGLILKGDLLQARGDPRSAATFYAQALNRAPPPEQRPGDLAAELARAEAALARYRAAFEAHLRTALADAGHATGEAPRFDHALDLMTGRAPLYASEPRFFLYPGLASVPFHPRQDWTPALEARTEAITAELKTLMTERPDAFRPYVEERENRPNSGGAGLIANADWSAVFLWKDGVEVPEITALCPATVAAMAEVPLAQTPGRTPSVLFSMLRPGARIPAHNGLVNTRLICHLPLIVPDGCRFRVGHETREWRPGECFAFDDTVEHEAWNDSAETRVVLIFDVWRPELSALERARVNALFAAVDAYGAGGGAWGV